MSTNIFIDTNAPKEDQYDRLLLQIEALIGDERNVVAVLSNVAAALHSGLGHLWTGFYLVHGDDLKLGPFQGPVACMSIAYGKGVCGAAWARKASIIVPDVDSFPGHIACNGESRSEIVVPILDGAENVKAVLDIDSLQLNTFDDVDQRFLEQLCFQLGKTLY